MERMGTRSGLIRARLKGKGPVHVERMGRVPVHVERIGDQYMWKECMRLLRVLPGSRYLVPFFYNLMSTSPGSHKHNLEKRVPGKNFRQAQIMGTRSGLIRARLKGKGTSTCRKNGGPVHVERMGDQYM